MGLTPLPSHLQHAADAAVLFEDTNCSFTFCRNEPPQVLRYPPEGESGTGCRKEGSGEEFRQPVLNGG